MIHSLYLKAIFLANLLTFLEFFRDSVTDMTVLMFACKAGASGVGDPKAAARVRLSRIDIEVIK